MCQFERDADQITLFRYLQSSTNVGLQRRSVAVDHHRLDNTGGNLAAGQSYTFDLLFDNRIVATRSMTHGFTVTQFYDTHTTGDLLFRGGSGSRAFHLGDDAHRVLARTWISKVRGRGAAHLGARRPERRLHAARRAATPSRQCDSRTAARCRPSHRNFSPEPPCRRADRRYGARSGLTARCDPE